MKKPNIILMLADDLGYGDISCLNPNSRIHTKNLDQLASEGLNCTDAHATSALCSPSRYGLLTGRYNWRSWLKSQVLIATEDNMIEEGRMTIASMLKGQGYRTACIGKWHLGVQWARTNNAPPQLDYSKMYDWADPNGWHTNVDYSKPYKNGPNDCGFDYFFGIANSLGTPPHIYMENDHALGVPDTMIGDPEHVLFSPKTALTSIYGPGASDYVPENVAMELQNKILDQIDEYAKSDDPFFIYYPCTPVHVPLLPTEEFQGKSGLGPYGDFVLMLDYMVGEIMHKLEEKGLKEDTIFIFASDNGCGSNVDYPGLISKGHNPSYVFRGAKGDIYDGGHKIPYIISYPNMIEPGTCNATVSLCDLMATLAELLDIKLPDAAAEDSISNLSLWKGDREPVRGDIVYSCLMGNLAIQKGDWRLEFLPRSGGASEMFNNFDYSDSPKFQLYNMRGDVGERCNLMDKHPDIVEDLTELMKKRIEDGRTTAGAEQKNTGPVMWKEIQNIYE